MGRSTGRGDAVHASCGKREFAVYSTLALRTLDGTRYSSGLPNLLGARRTGPNEFGSPMSAIISVAVADEELEGAGGQNGAQDGAGRGRAVHDSRQAGVSLRLLQRPLVAGEEPSQRAVLDAQQAEQVARGGTPLETGAEGDDGQVVGGAGATQTRRNQDHHQRNGVLLARCEAQHIGDLPAVDQRGLRGCFQRK